MTLRPASGASWRQTPQPVTDGMTLDTCPVCFGVWLDAGEIDALGDAEIDPAFLLGFGTLHQNPTPRFWHAPNFNGQLRDTRQHAVGTLLGFDSEDKACAGNSTLPDLE